MYIWDNQNTSWYMLSVFVFSLPQEVCVTSSGESRSVNKWGCNLISGGYNFFSFRFLYFLCFLFSSSWTTWLIPAIAALAIGLMYRFYTLEHKSSWFQAFCTFWSSWRPWHVGPKPPCVECTHLRQSFVQRKEILSTSSRVKAFKIVCL